MCAVNIYSTSELKITAGPRPFSVQLSTMATQNLVLNCTDGRSNFKFGRPNLKSYFKLCTCHEFPIIHTHQLEQGTGNASMRPAHYRYDTEQPVPKPMPVICQVHAALTITPDEGPGQAEML